MPKRKIEIGNPPIDENYLDKEASHTIKKAVFTLKLKYREVVLMEIRNS
ncbi:hypothetical protein [Sporosarcina globispora]|nr:hypothetical protein [Sporosarcina globispora]